MDPIVSALLILAAFAAYSVLHSILAAPRAKDLAARRFGEALVYRTYRLFFNLVGVATLFPILVLVLWLPDRLLYVVPPFVGSVFTVGQIIGILIIVDSLGRSDFLDFAGLRQLAHKKKTPLLVTNGVYRFIRHPLYTGSMLVLWLLPRTTLNWFAFNLGISLYFIIGATFEERKLERFFGKTYADYKASTPAFLPWPRHRK